MKWIHIQKRENQEKKMMEENKTTTKKNIIIIIIPTDRTIGHVEKKSGLRASKQQMAQDLLSWSVQCHLPLPRLGETWAEIRQNGQEERKENHQSGIYLEEVEEEE